MGRKQEVLYPISYWGVQEKLTRDEVCLIDTFAKIYLVALAEEKGIETTEEFVDVIADNVRDVWDIAIAFKYLRYPNEVMDRDRFTEHTTSVLIKRFGEKETGIAINLMYKSF